LIYVPFANFGQIAQELLMGTNTKGDTKQNDQEYNSDSWRACGRGQLVPRGQRSGSFRSRHQKDGSK
jgi:hypothetical protein